MLNFMDSDAVALTIFAKVLTNTNHREVAKLETKLSCKRKNTSIALSTLGVCLKIIVFSSCETDVIMESRTPLPCPSYGRFSSGDW